MYVPQKGCVICSCDYSQEELITLAATQKVWFGRSRMADAINAGLCLHSTFAGYRDGVLEGVDITKLSDPDVAKVVKDRVKAYKTDPVLKKHRKLAKAANFGYKI